MTQDVGQRKMLSCPLLALEFVFAGCMHDWVADTRCFAKQLAMLNSGKKEETLSCSRLSPSIVDAMGC